MDSTRHQDLLTKSLRIKKRFLGMYQNARAGHVGCSLSVTEILTFIRFHCMNEQDEIILSKGHAAASLYSLLAEEGTLSEQDIHTFYKNETYLAAHPPVNKIKRIPFATGSLGHGLSLAAGLGLANRMKNTGKKIFCVLSDGELNEGSTWEAALFMAHHRLNNVCVFVDRNGLQGFGRTEDVMHLEPLDKKFSSFGFHTLMADGHDFNSLEKAYNDSLSTHQPCAIICRTTKGHGWKQFENQVDCHYLPMKAEDYEAVMAEAERFYNEQINTL